MVLLQCIFKYFKPLPIVYWLCIIVVCALLYFSLNKIFPNEFKKQKIAAIILLAYILYAICLLVILRTSGVKSGIEINPFWMYEKIANGYYFWPEIIGNILFGVPIGFLMIIVSSMWLRNQWLQVVVTVAFSLFFSVIIEFMQYILRRGLADFGDIFNNVIGTILGAILCLLIRNVRKRLKNR